MVKEDGALVEKSERKMVIQFYYKTPRHDEE